MEIDYDTDADTDFDLETLVRGGWLRPDQELTPI
jgi:hypothetical protein